MVAKTKMIFSCIDDVVKNTDIQQLSCLANLVSDALVFSTWFDIASWMIVSENHRYSISK